MLAWTVPVPAQVFIPTVPFSCLWLALTPWTPGPLDIGIATFVALVALSQQFHSWAHMKRSELPSAVAALQVCFSQYHQQAVFCEQCHLRATLCVRGSQHVPVRPVACQHA